MATGVLSLLYCVFIIAVYAFLDEVYKSKSEIPLADFFLTTVLAIFWLSGSAAWSNGTNALKTVTDVGHLSTTCSSCGVSTSSFSGLNISLVSFLKKNINKSFRCGGKICVANRKNVLNALNVGNGPFGYCK